MPHFTSICFLQLISLSTRQSKNSLQWWHHTLITHYQRHSSCLPVIQFCHTAIQIQEDIREGGMRYSYIIKVKVSFKQGFSLLFSLRPCPISLPGHAVLLECGQKILIWGLGLARNKNGGRRQRCDLVMAPPSRDRRWGIQAFQPNTCEPDIEPLSQAWPEVDQLGLDYCSCCYELSIFGLMLQQGRAGNPRRERIGVTDEW